MSNKKIFLINKNKLIILFLFLFIFFLSFSFIKNRTIKSDNLEYLSMAINISLNKIISSDDHQKKNITYKIDRSAAYPILISTLLNKDILKKK